MKEPRSRGLTEAQMLFGLGYFLMNTRRNTEAHQHD